MKIFVMYDTENQTWNIMEKLGKTNHESKCICYGTIFTIEKWLKVNDGLFTEVKN